MLNIFRLLPILTILLIHSSIYSQEDSVGFFSKEKIIFGGNFSISFGSNTFFDIEPEIGYKLTKSTKIGVGAIYSYLYMREYKEGVHTYGCKVFAMQSFFNYFLLYTEYQAVNLDAETFLVTTHYPEGRYWYNGLFLGGGIQQHFSKNGIVYVLCLLDVLYTVNSPYYNPVIKAGILF